MRRRYLLQNSSVLLVTNNSADADVAGSLPYCIAVASSDTLISSIVFSDEINDVEGIGDVIELSVPMNVDVEYIGNEHTQIKESSSYPGGTFLRRGKFTNLVIGGFTHTSGTFTHSDIISVSNCMFKDITITTTISYTGHWFSDYFNCTFENVTAGDSGYNFTTSTYNNCLFKTCNLGFYSTAYFYSSLLDNCKALGIFIPTAFVDSSIIITDSSTFSCGGSGYLNCTLYNVFLSQGASTGTYMNLKLQNCTVYINRGTNQYLMAALQQGALSVELINCIIGGTISKICNNDAQFNSYEGWLGHDNIYMNSGTHRLPEAMGEYYSGVVTDLINTTLTYYTPSIAYYPPQSYVQGKALTDIPETDIRGFLRGEPSDLGPYATEGTN